MEFLWSPWRYDYLASAGQKTSSCVFCIGEDSGADRERLIVWRGVHNFIILNLFPYTSGHLMIAPYAHPADVTHASAEQTSEMMELTKRAITTLRKTYSPEGFNVGMNLGHCAGAGVREHFHLHVVPRWTGDANFMTITGETRVLPEELKTTYDRLKKAFGL
ncbi:MAG: HIT domain-containing protein [Acidobacteria bacterium]|nr:HIT domain-containing protein [Acidobacteriota bacterium]